MMIRFLLTFLVLSFVIGCSTENPLCTDNYCITGEVFSKDDLEEGQTFEVLPVDESSLIVAISGAALKTTPEEWRTLIINAATPKDEANEVPSDDTVPDDDAVPSDDEVPSDDVPIEKTTPEEWRTLIREQGNIPVLDILTVTEALRIQMADRPPSFCISLDNESIEDVVYTAHRSTWVRFTTTIDPLGDFGIPKTIRSFSVIASSIADGEICGIEDTEIWADSIPEPFEAAFERTHKYQHRLIVDMTVDGSRQLYVSPTTFSKN